MMLTSARRHPRSNTSRRIIGNVQTCAFSKSVAAVRRPAHLGPIPTAWSAVPSPADPAPALGGIRVSRSDLGADGAVPTRGSADQSAPQAVSLETNDPPLVRKLKSAVLAGPRFHAAEADLARELGLSSRTLRRRLRGLGTTYANILAEVRFAFAKRCLADVTLTISEVADRVGYTEVSNFRCAFKRWANRSPREFRAELAVGDSKSSSA